MAHLQYMPGDPRLVDQVVYELKSKGIFDQFRKECIADVDTRPAYQNLRQRVESSVSTFLSRQSWTPDMNKNQLREKLRKNILDGNYLEQGLERIVDQVVNPKVASVFKPQVEDLVYNYLGIARKRTTIIPETTNIKLIPDDLLPTDLEAVSPESVKSYEDKELENPSESKDEIKMDVDEVVKPRAEDIVCDIDLKSEKTEGDTQLPGISDLSLCDTDTSLDRSNIPLPGEDINPENIPPPENSPPKTIKVELEKIELPKEPNLSTDIPLPDEIVKDEKEHYFKPINSEDDSSSDSSLRRNMSPLTPIRNFNNENSCDAQQAFENVSNEKSEVTKEPSSFRFTIEKTLVSSTDELKTEKKDSDQAALSYQFNNQVNINTFNTPLYDDSSNSNNLRIDYESDANSKTNVENKQSEVIASQSNQHVEETKKDQKNEEKKSSHKSSHHSRDSHRHSSSSKDKRSDSKHSSSKDRKDSKIDKKLSKDDPSRSKSSHSDKPKEKRDKKDSRDSSKHRSSTHKSSSHKDSKSHRSASTSSSHKYSSKNSDDKKTPPSSHKDRSDKSSDKTSRDKCSKDAKPTHRSDKDKKSSTPKSKQDEKEKKDKKDTDDHYSLSGRGNPNRRSTDRDSNDGSSSSKGSQNQANSKSSGNKNNKGTSSKCENTSTSNDSTSPSDNDHVVNETASETKNSFLPKPIIRIDSHLGIPASKVPHLPFVPDVTLKKPKFAANLAEAKRLMKMRRFLAEEQRRMNQEAALLLEFQANVRPSLSQVYSSIPGPELEFVCDRSILAHPTEQIQFIHENHSVQAAGVQVNNHEATEETIIDDHNNLHRETVHSRNSENSDKTTVHNNPMIQENIVYNDVFEQTNSIALEESPYTPTMELTRDKINEIIGVASFTVNNEISNEHEPHNEAETKMNTITLEDPDIHNFNKEEFTKEIINEIIGVGAFENNIEVENNNVLKSQLKGSESVLIYDSDDENKKRFEVTIINETVDDTNNSNSVDSNEAFHRCTNDKNIDNDEIIDIDDIDDKKENEKKNENIEISDSEEDNRKRTGFFEVTIITEEVSDEKEIDDECIEITTYTEEKPLEYFGEQEKFNAEIEKEKFVNFLKSFSIENGASNKIYLINCDAYEKNILKEVSKNFGRFEIVNYHKNGCLKLSKAKKNVIKNVKINTKIILPVEKDANDYDSGKSNSPLLSPTKSEYSFDLPTDYDAKLDEMMKKASKRDIMEIILGIPEESPSNESKLDYSDYSLESGDHNLKRKLFEIDVLDNNNKNVLTPNKIRKLSGSDQISSTTEETEENISNRNNITRSKYLGKARRVGLPRPRRCTLPNSPSSDKSVENYEQNSITKTPNGKLKATPRSKVQRYDTSDLYKPKLHYLSRRNNVS